MAKKLICVWLSITIVLFSNLSVFAEESVIGDFFIKHVVINGGEIVNYNLQYPFVMYNSSMYLPLTGEICEICGIRTELDRESRTLKLTKVAPTRKNISANYMKNDNQDLTLTVLDGAKVIAYSEEAAALEALNANGSGLIASAAAIIEEAGTAPEPIDADAAHDIHNTDRDATIESDIARAEAAEMASASAAGTEELDLAGLPVLMAGKYVYVPVRAFTTSEVFGWSSWYSSYYGLCVSTDPAVSAASYSDAAEVLRNKGLVRYIRDNNPSLSAPAAQDMLFFFNRAAALYGVDRDLLMAIACTESNFDPTAGSGSGAIGVMQIMAATGAGYGLSVSQLHDAKTNIDFGAMYIAARINDYGGNVEKGLSAYNQGPGKVNRGTYSKAYATRVLSRLDSMHAFLSGWGYVM